MREKWPVAPAGSDDADFTIGCLVGGLSGLVGDAFGTLALLVFHSDWLYSEGDPVETIVGGVAIAWVVGVATAVIAGLVLIASLSRVAPASPASRSTAQFNLVLLFIVPATVAAITLWVTASVNR